MTSPVNDVDSTHTAPNEEESFIADPGACRGSCVRYRSPLRPLWGLPSREAMCLDCTAIGEWHPSKVYSFHKPIEEHTVRQWSLEEVS